MCYISAMTLYKRISKCLYQSKQIYILPQTALSAFSGDKYVVYVHGPDTVLNSSIFQLYA